MASPIKITISGKASAGVDAPTVDDLFAQIHDIVSVLRGVDEAVSDGNGEEIEWRVTNATKNSPLTFEVTPFPKRHAMNIDGRAREVVAATASGMRALARGGERPMYFSDVMMGKVEKVYGRVTNGLSSTLIDMSAYDGADKISVTVTSALDALVNLRSARSPEPVSYREFGSVEGVITKVELDGRNRPIVWLRRRIDGQIVKCVSKGRGLDRIGHYEVAEVLNGLRIEVLGLISYKDFGRISSVDVEVVRVFPNEHDLPDIDQIVAPGFTGGIEAVEYLRRLREDG